jgi:hypothetical protein
MSGVMFDDQRLLELLRLQRRVGSEIASVVERKSAPTVRRSRYEIPPCGSESAYQRHRYRGEERDHACKLGHSRYEMLRAAGAKPDPLAPLGIEDVA